jgi:hypothetical protein
MLYRVHLTINEVRTHNFTLLLWLFIVCRYMYNLLYYKHLLLLFVFVFFMIILYSIIDNTKFTCWIIVVLIKFITILPVAFIFMGSHVSCTVCVKSNLHLYISPGDIIFSYLVKLARVAPTTTLQI